MRCSPRYCRGHSSGSAPARLPRPLPSTSLFRDGTQPPARCVKTLSPRLSLCFVCSNVHSDNLYRKSRRTVAINAAVKLTVAARRKSAAIRIVESCHYSLRHICLRRGCTPVSGHFASLSVRSQGYSRVALLPQAAKEFTSWGVQGGCNPPCDNSPPSPR